MGKLSTNTSSLRTILAAVNSLPEAGGGSAKKTITVTVTNLSSGNLTYFDENAIEQNIEPYASNLHVEALCGLIRNGFDGYFAYSATISGDFFSPMSSMVIFYSDGGSLTYSGNVESG